MQALNKKGSEEAGTISMVGKESLALTVIAVQVGLPLLSLAVFGCVEEPGFSRLARCLIFPLRTLKIFLYFHTWKGGSQQTLKRKLCSVS